MNDLPTATSAPALANDRWLNFPDMNGAGVVSVDRHDICAVQDVFDKSGQPVIGAAYIHLKSGVAIPVAAGRHAIITTCLMAEQGMHSDDKPPLAS